MKQLSFYTGIITFLLSFYACKTNVYQVNAKDKKQLSISDNIQEDISFSEVIAPYKAQMQNELNQVLVYNPYDLHKKGHNYPLGVLVTDLMLKEGNEIYDKLHPGKKIDVCVLNSGGIRRTFTKGDLTVQSMYELMPFENSAVVITLTGQKFLDMVNYLKADKRLHPISGFTFKVYGEEPEIVIGGEPFNINKTYTVLTNDYLEKGGDKMNFFKDAVKSESLNAKMRDMYIEYFKGIDTIKLNTNPRYILN